MENGQKKVDVKFTKEKNMIAHNINTLMNNKKISVMSMAEKIGVSRQALYDIRHGRAMPRKDTLDLIANELGVTSEILRNGIRHFDYEHFKKLVYEKFPKQINKEDYDSYIDYIDSQELDIDEFDIESFLIYKFNVDPVDMFIKNILPPEKMRMEISNYFEYEPNELFVSYGCFPLGKDTSGLMHINVAGKEKFDNKKFQDVFVQLDLQSKKMVFNICLDLLKIQSS